MKRFFFILISGYWLLASGFAPAIEDVNNNGLSDYWERGYNAEALFPETFDPQGNYDADGWNNTEEAVAGTDPYDANPPDGLICPVTGRVPAVMGEQNGIPVIITPEVITVSWPTLAGKQYTLKFSADLSQGSWISVGNPFIATGGQVTYNFEVNDADKRFWRVAVNDVDTDGDGRTDHEEHEIGTNPSVPRIWAFMETANPDGTVTFTWNSYATNGDWFQIESQKPDGTWKTIYSTTYGSLKLPFMAGSLSYSLTLNPQTDYQP